MPPELFRLIAAWGAAKHVTHQAVQIARRDKIVHPGDFNATHDSAHKEYFKARFEFLFAFRNGELDPEECAEGLRLMEMNSDQFDAMSKELAEIE